MTATLGARQCSRLYDYLRIYSNCCSVHEEITSIRLYTPTQTEQIISINPYELIMCYDIEKYIYFFKIK